MVFVLITLYRAEHGSVRRGVRRTVKSAATQPVYRQTTRAGHILRRHRVGVDTGRAGVLAARMSAAVEVLEAAGMAVDRADDVDAHLRRAVSWQRYSRGPVSDLHRRCALDIVRGSLRLWERAGGVAEAPA